MTRRNELLSKFASLEESITYYMYITPEGDPKREVMRSIRYGRYVKTLNQCEDLDEFEFQVEKMEAILNDIREVSKW